MRSVSSRSVAASTDRSPEDWGDASSSAGSSTFKKKWNPLRRFLKRNKKPPTYDFQETETIDDFETERPKRQNHASSTDSLSADDHILQEIFVEEGAKPDGDNPCVFTEKSVYEFIWDYNDAFAKALEILDKDAIAWQNFWVDNHTPDYLFIRPSGNPLNLQALIKQMAKGELSDYEEDVIMVDSIKLLANGTCAVIVYRSETRFFYQGTKVEDTRTNTMVLVWHDGKPKITSIQRSMGKDINSSS